MYGYGAANYHAPVYQQQYAQPLYAQTTNEYLGPAKVLNWTPTERELLDRTLPVEADMELASVRRARSIYDGMNEYEREESTAVGSVGSSLKTRVYPVLYALRVLCVSMVTTCCAVCDD